MRLLCLLAALAFPPLMSAQATVRSSTPLLAAPSGRTLATFRDAVTVQPGTARGGAVQVTVQGYLHRSLLGPPRDSFRISVNASGGALLRASPARGGRVIALLHNGMGLHEVSRRGEWVQVRRTGWVAASAVQRQQQARTGQQARPARQGTTAAASTRQQQQVSRPRETPAPAATQVVARVERAEAQATDSAPGALEPDAREAAPFISEDMTPTRRVPLAAAPGGTAVGAVEAGTRVTPLARDRGWVRVRVEGWIPDTSLTVADSALRSSPSAADLRADPEAAKGRAVRWEVQVLAFQTADQLRRDMTPDEPYLLARGPGGENTILYLALPQGLVANARAIPSLSIVTITGRVRVAQSAPAGVPIIDVQSITRR